jgi:PAS domain S-box-containing protein
MKNDRAMELDKEEQIQLATRVMKRVSQPMIATSADRRLLYWNAAFSKLTGYNNKELTDPIISAGLTAPEWHESEIKALEKLQHTGKSQVFQKEYIRKDGSRVPVEVLVYQLSEGNGKVEYYVGLITDITQRKEREEALQKSESHYRSLVNSAIEGIVVIQDGGIKFVNPIVAIETGYSREELQSMPLKKLFAPDNEKAAVESISKAAVPGSLLVVPLLKIRTKTGEIRLIESTITSIVWDDKPANLNLLRDITEHYQTEETLQQSEKKYRSILEDIREGYWETDLAGNFVSFNDAVCRLVGYSEKDITGANYRSYTSAADVDKVYKAFNKVYRTGKPIRNMHYEIVRKDGSKRFAETSVFPRRNGKGEIIGFRGVTHDVTERVQIEEALKRSEEKYRTILENMEESYWEEDLAGKFTFVNNTLCRHLGYSREELIGIDYHTYIPPEEVDRVFQAYNQVYRTGKPISLFRTQEIRKDGSRVDSEISIAPLQNEKGDIVGFRGVGRDITASVTMEEALRQSEEKYRTILEDMEETYFELDLAGNFTFFNNALCLYFGYSREELTGMNYRSYVPPEEVEGVAQAYNQVYRTGEPIAIFPKQDIRKDGTRVNSEISIVPLRNANGEIVGFRGVGRDITKRVQTEKALIQSEEKYRSVLEHMEEAYSEVDLAGNFTFFNEALCRHLGYSREELLGMNYKVYTTPENAKQVFQAYNQVYKTGEPIKLLAIEETRKDGTQMVAEISVSPLINETGKIIGFREVSRDITERMKMEEALRQSEARYRTILDTTEESYYEVDLAGNFTFFNEPLRRGLGYTKEELVGMNYRVYTPPEIADKVFQAYNQVYRTGEPLIWFPMEQVSKDGTRAIIENSVLPKRNERGEIIGFRGIGRDISKRVQMEEALRKSELRYRTILEDMQESYFETDLAGNYTMFNDAQCRQLGYTREEMAGMNYKVITPPDRQKEVFEIYNRIHRTGEPNQLFQAEQIKKDGTRIPVEYSAFPIRNDKGEIIGFRGVGRDITRRVEIEEALIRSEERYRTVLEDMEEAYYELDVAGNYTFFNNALCNQLGYSREELIGMNYKTYTLPEDIERVFEAFNHVYRTGEPLDTFPMERIKKDGTRIFAETSCFPLRDERGDITGFRGVVRDITKRKQMEEALRRSEERYRTVLEDMEESYYELDLAGNYTFFNDALCRMLGYSKKDLMGLNYKAYTIAEDLDRVFKTFNRLYRTGEPLTAFPMERIRKDGQHIFTETSGFRLLDEKGETIGFRGVIRDITKQKNAEEERKQLEQKAQLSSRLASVGELASGVAHEINNPLTGVIGYAHLLLARKDISRDVRRDLEIINEGSQRVAGIVKKLLAFARQTKPEQRYVNINELIRNTLDLRAYELAASNIKVTLQLVRDMPMTIADPGQLQQVFLNLIINAETEMKIARDGGRLTIKTDRINNTIRITFKDTGPGIAKENLETIFDPFFTTREVGQGTGLGLSVCHGIVTEHNGKIWAESEPGKGATFIVELPLATEEEEHEPPEPVIEEPKKVTKAKMLVVDDEPVIRQLISKVLGEQGHTVDTIDNAAGALRMVKSKRYRLILLDIKMPGMSGIELYKQFQKIAPSLTKRIVFITGDVMGKRTTSFLDKTKTPCIMKPFDARQLKVEINRILAKK